MKKYDKVTWTVIIQGGASFPHKYSFRASNRLSVHILFLILQAGLRLFGVASLKDEGIYLGLVRSRKRHSQERE